MSAKVKVKALMQDCKPRTIDEIVDAIPGAVRKTIQAAARDLSRPGMGQILRVVGSQGRNHAIVYVLFGAPTTAAEAVRVGATLAEVKTARVSIARRIAELMQDEKERSTAQIVAELNAPEKTVRSALSEMCIEGFGQEVHISRRFGRVNFYKAGEGDNAPEEYQSPAHAAKAAARKQRLADQIAGKWWPVACPVTVSAMHNMVTAGRVAA
ncbi:hypothetical protein AB4Y36_10165 [Paraburkholderia sp. BR10936]|uniref:hypothetical protein n=1 Tax=Paraburkholderia sp. BR10936 TaxID=3236993 RepID=UPI0034D1B4B8